MNIRIRRFRLAKGLKPTQLIFLGGSMMFQMVGNNSYPGQPCSNGGTYFRSLFFWLYQLVIYNIIKFTHSSKTSPFVLVTLELKVVFVPHIFSFTKPNIKTEVYAYNSSDSFLHLIQLNTVRAINTFLGWSTPAMSLQMKMF